MRKQIIILLICVVLTGGLAGAYFVASDMRSKEDARLAEEKRLEQELKQEQTASTSIPIISGDLDNVESIDYASDDFEMTLYPTFKKNESYNTDETIWIVEGYDESVFDQWSVLTLAESSYNLKAAEKALDSIDNPDNFGLTRPARTVTVNYLDGGMDFLKIGKATPDKEFYYCSVEGDPALYLLSYYTAERLMSTYDSLIDKTVATVNPNMITYANIIQKGQKEIEIGFPGTEEQQLKDLETYGTAALQMIKPFEGRQIYVSNFGSNFVELFNLITFDTLVEMSPSDYSQYGLDEPEYEVILHDAETISHLVFGKAEDNYIYAKFGGTPSVYLADRYAVEDLMNVSVYSYIEKFIALIYIDRVDRLKIESKDVTYTFDMMHTIIPSEDESLPDDNIITPSIDGTILQEKAYQRFYQTVIGISSDSHVDGYTPTGEPEYTITYTLNDQPDPLVLKFYPYNNDFYVSQIDDEPTEFVVSKYQLEMMMMYVQELLDGKLDD